MYSSSGNKNIFGSQRRDTKSHSSVKDNHDSIKLNMQHSSTYKKQISFGLEETESKGGIDNGSNVFDNKENFIIGKKKKDEKSHVSQVDSIKIDGNSCLFDNDEEKYEAPQKRQSITIKPELEKEKEKILEDNKKDNFFELKNIKREPNPISSNNLNDNTPIKKESLKDENLGHTKSDEIVKSDIEKNVENKTNKNVNKRNEELEQKKKLLFNKIDKLITNNEAEENNNLNNNFHNKDNKDGKLNFYFKIYSLKDY
jgi:hypothetical protein